MINEFERLGVKINKKCTIFDYFLFYKLKFYNTLYYHINIINWVVINQPKKYKN